jgi:hypothetical protein
MRKRSNMDQKKLNHGYMYRIRLEGALGRSVADWLGDITIIPQENGGTLLVGQFADQPALRGLLDQLWNLNFTIVSFERIENENNK